jgi:hypothetical protein
LDGFLAKLKGPNGCGVLRDMRKILKIELAKILGGQENEKSAKNDLDSGNDYRPAVACRLRVSASQRQRPR